MRNTRNTARFLSFLTVLAVLLTAGIVLGINASAEATTETSVGTAQELVDALANGGTIVLTKDIYLGDAYTTEGTWTPTTTSISATVTIKSGEGGPYTIYRGIQFGAEETVTISAAATPMFTLSAGANVTLTNVILDGQKPTDENPCGIIDTVTVGGAFYYGAGKTNAPTLTLNEGAVIQNFAAYQGGAVGFTRGKIVIDGGKISNNVASYAGGGIYADSTEVEFKSGLIGGAITDAEGKVTSNNGNISKGSGGGIMLANSGKLTMTGGTISYNHATGTGTSGNGGGGIGASAGSATIILSGTAKITNNTADDEYMTAGKRSYGGGIYTLGTLIMMGDAEVSNNTCQSVYSSGSSYYTNEGGGIYLAPKTSGFWMLGGKVINNTLKGRAGAGVVVKNVAYIFGGTISNNTMQYLTTSTTNIAAYGGGAIYLSNGSLYLCGGTIGSSTFLNKSGTGKTNDSAYHKEIFIKNDDTKEELAKVYLGSSVTGVTIPLDVLDAVGTVTGITVSEDNSKITSTNPLKMEDDDKVTYEINSGNFVYYYKDSEAAVHSDVAEHVILKNDLPAGSKVVFADNDATLGYFLTLAADYTPSAATLNAICLAGADSLYNATVSGTTLAWPTAADAPYQITRSATLNDMVDFHLVVAFRDKTARQKVKATMTDMYGENTYNATEDDDASRVKVPMAPKYMTTEVTLYLGEQELGKYKLADYLKDVETKYANDKELVALVKSLMNYGSAAQVYLAYEPTNLANGAYKTDLENVTVETTGENAFSIVGNNGEAFHSADVEIASKVSVTVIMKAAAYNGGFTVELGGNQIENVPYKEVTADYIAITIKDISAADLVKSIVVTLSDGTTLTYSIPAYAGRMLDKENDGAKINDDLKVLVNALYAYAVAANAYAAANAAN